MRNVYLIASEDGTIAKFTGMLTNSVFAVCPIANTKAFPLAVERLGPAPTSNPLRVLKPNSRRGLQFLLTPVNHSE
jgi:hypothetical protein